MDHHPLDARSPPAFPKGNEVCMKEDHYILGDYQLRGLPSLQDLFLGCPSRPFSVCSDPGDHELPLNAVDIAAVHLATGTVSRELLTSAQNWARAHSLAAIERFSLGLALHITWEPGVTWEPGSRSLIISSLESPELRAVIPTIDRTKHTSFWGEPDGYQTTEDTMHLRNTGWRDGAGRTIDQYLVEGLLRQQGVDPRPDLTRNLTGPGAEADKAETRANAKAKAIDSRLPSHDLHIHDLVFKKGLILDDDRRAEIKTFLKLHVAGKGIDLEAVARCLGSTFSPPIGEKLFKDLLDGDRANRAAAAQVATPEPAAPGSACTDPEPHPIGMTL